MRGRKLPRRRGIRTQNLTAGVVSNRSLLVVPDLPLHGIVRKKPHATRPRHLTPQRGRWTLLASRGIFPSLHRTERAQGCAGIAAGGPHITRPTET